MILFLVLSAVIALALNIARIDRVREWWRS